ncbi:acyl-CoA dehydrogenase family protein [Nannocystis pusilla]|uniref:acyl-CoA dehydrogenase family protein n=1 Tax=Nannocystis pusilla TaxID=889268 RepID=UPI003BF22D19
MPGLPVWTRLCPVDVLRHPVVAGVAELLAAPDIQAALHEGQRAGTYPAEVVAALRRIGVARLYTDEAEVFHLCGLNAIAAAVDGSLAITLGVNALALLPVHLGAGPELRARIFKKINDGAFAAMLLTELDHGSNLLRNEAAATPHPDGGYRLSGEKHLINGATHHDVLVALMRTARGGAVAFGDFSVFCVDRDDSVEALPRWSTLPARAADIAGVRFHGTHVPEDSLVGKLGDGFSLVQRTLTLSRGGISGLASGSASGALALALAYAHTRDVYGAPIVGLDAIADHLVAHAELDLVTAAMAVKAAVAANALGIGAAIYTAAAKLACCALAEEAVEQGRRVVSSRALLADRPYEKFVRDVTLYGVFDGTSHLMLTDLSLRLPQIVKARDDVEPTLPRVAAMFAAPARPLAALGDARAPVRHLDLPAHARALDAIDGGVGFSAFVALADALVALGRGLRGHKAWNDQGVRFALAEALAWLECAFAAVELADPARRAAVGAPAWSSGQPVSPDILVGALAGLGLRARARLLEVAAAAGLPVPGDMSEVERTLVATRTAARPGARAWVRAQVP